MGQLIIPTDKKIEGPWLLDSKALEELHGSLEIIETKLNEAYETIVERTAEIKMEEYRKRRKGVDISIAKEKVRGSYPFKKSEKYLLLLSKQGNKIKDSSLLSLLKDPQIEEFAPTEIRIRIEKGPCKFSMELSSEYDGALETRIEALDDRIFSDINYEINKWIDKRKPNFILQKWSSWFPSVSLFIFMILLIMSPILFKDKKDLYKTELSKEVRELLKDGIGKDEITKAIEIILQREVDYIPDDFKYNIEINSTIVKIWFTVLIGIIILSIAPKTTIGLGKSKWKVKFYKRWIYFVLVFLPLFIIIPYVINKIM